MAISDEGIGRLGVSIADLLYGCLPLISSQYYHDVKDDPAEILNIIQA